MPSSPLRLVLASVPAIAFAALPFATANLSDIYGSNSYSSSLAGASVARAQNPASVSENPAALALGDESAPRLQVHWSVLYVQPRFKPISNVVIANDYTSDTAAGAPTIGNVDTEYESTFGQVLGMSYRLKDSPWALGFQVFLPLASLATMDSGEAFAPEYPLYRARTQKPEFDFGLGYRAWSDFSVGAGLHLGSNLDGQSTVFLQTDTAKASTMRLNASLKTKAMPYFGILHRASRDFQWGVKVQVPFAQREDFRANTGFNALGGLSSLRFTLPGMATAYYDPLSVQLGARYRYARSSTLFLQVDYEAWSRFEEPSISIDSPQTTAGGVQFGTTKNPMFEYRDLVIPHLGHEWTVGEWAVRAGYSYRQSILKNLPTDAGNYLDPPSHRLTAGAGVTLDHFLDFNTPCRIDFQLTYILLVAQDIEKTSGNEAGNGASRKIGAPGYEAGGDLLGGGVSLNLFF